MDDKQLELFVGYSCDSSRDVGYFYCPYVPTQLTTEKVYAKPTKLPFTWSVSYDVPMYWSWHDNEPEQMSLDLDIESRPKSIMDEVTDSLAEILRKEIDAEIMAKMLAIINEAEQSGDKEMSSNDNEEYNQENADLNRLQRAVHHLATKRTDCPEVQLDLLRRVAGLQTESNLLPGRNNRSSDGGDDQQVQVHGPSKLADPDR